MARPVSGPHPPVQVGRSAILAPGCRPGSDAPIVGELARLLPEKREQLLHSRSARDLVELARQAPDLVAQLVAERPVLAAIAGGFEELRIALERERFAIMDADRLRIGGYLAAARDLETHWPELERRVAGLPLRRAHQVVVECAERWLPTVP